MLSGLKIQEEIKQGNIVISPYNEEQLNPNSYNLRLHDELLVYSVPRLEKMMIDGKEATLQVNCLDMKADNPTRKILIPKEGFILQPGELYLGRTVEHTETPYHVPMLEGRSSGGRLGISVHATAGFGDIGFKGFWTLEISCIKPVKIYPNVEICQISYNNIDGEYESYSSGKYQNNKEVQASKLYQEF